MKSFFLESYVLVLGQQSDDLHLLKTLLDPLTCSVAVTSSADQAVARANQAPPCLVILAGESHTWSHTLVRQLRSSAHACQIMIVALTDCHAPSWLPQEQNPGFDGFLVKPLSGEVLSSVVESAWARQACCFAP